METPATLVVKRVWLAVLGRPDILLLAAYVVFISNMIFATFVLNAMPVTLISAVMALFSIALWSMWKAKNM